MQLVEWLLGLEQIHLVRDAPLRLQWEAALPAWLLFGLALLTLGFLVFCYYRETGSVQKRATLFLFRCMLVALVTIVFCRPSLVLQRNRVEPSHVVVAVDTSWSMAQSEAYHEPELAEAVARGAGLDSVHDLQRHSRFDLVRSALMRNDAAPLRQLFQHNGVHLCTFDGRLRSRGFFSSDDSLPEMVETLEVLVPDGRSTDLAGAIREALRRGQGRRLAAIILISDGRSTHPGGLGEMLDLASDRQIPIYPVPLGSPTPAIDVEVGPLRSEPSVFAGDILAIEARVAARGLQAPEVLTVHLVDERSDQTIARQEITLDPDASESTLELLARPTIVGPARYRVEVPPLSTEQNTDNNVDRIELTVSDSRLRVLYVEGYPRYEYRYLVNALLREPTISLSVLLLEADEQFIQEGTDPIRRLPLTPEEFNRYDVILFGDVEVLGEWISPVQMERVVDFVSEYGGGFGLLAGPRSVPHRLGDTPLEKLLPVRLGRAGADERTHLRTLPFRLRLTTDGVRSRVFRFTTDLAENRRLVESLPELYWIARTAGPKPTAIVLAEHPALQTDDGPMPLVVTGRYGAGKLFFQATDDTWRWRRHTGEWLHDAYWVQVVRALQSPSRTADDRRFSLRTDQRIYPYGSTIIIQVKVEDARLLNRLADQFDLRITRPASEPSRTYPASGHSPGLKIPHGGIGAGSGSGTPESGATLPSGPSSAAPPQFQTVVSRILAHRLGPRSNIFEASWTAPTPGDFLIQAAIQPDPGTLTPASVADGPVARIRVDRPDLEGRRPEADHQTLQRIADATGGVVADLDKLEAVFAAVKDRSVQIPDDIVEPLWDSRLVLLLFMAMISMEWILRKTFGLL